MSEATFIYLATAFMVAADALTIAVHVGAL